MVIKLIIIVYLLIICGLVLMIPVKLLSTEQICCPGCTMPSLHPKRKKDYNCPHCGRVLRRDGKIVFHGGS